MSLDRQDYDSNEAFWHALACRAQNGDKSAYNAFLKDIGAFAKNYLARSVASDDWVEDISQEVLVSVHKALGTFNKERPFTPWLMSIISFRRTDYLRKHYRERQNEKTSLDNPEYLKSAVTNPVIAGEYKDMEAALATLPRQQQNVLKMVKLEGYTASEVAEKTGMSVSSVKVTTHRALKKLEGLIK